MDWLHTICISSFALITGWCLLRPAMRRSLDRDELFLAVYDLGDTLRYYEEVLGFSHPWRWNEGEAFGGVDRGDLRVHFSTAPGLARRGLAAPVVLEVDEIDALFEDHQRRGARVIESLEGPRGQRGYAVEDLNGYSLRFVERDGARDAIPGFILPARRAPATPILSPASGPGRPRR